MRTPLLPPLLLLCLAAALYFLPDGASYAWRLRLQGAIARLDRPPDPRPDAGMATFSDRRDLLDLLSQKDAEIADLNRRIRDLGVTTESVPNVRIIPARVMRLGPDNSLDTYTIDVGTRQGVVAGQAVVVGQVLVGVVARAEEEASLVLSLSSPGCYISARLGEREGAVGRPRILGAVKGAGAGRVRAVVFSSGSAGQQGWLAMTSGLEKNVPEQLVLGSLAERFEPGEESGTMEAELRPGVDLDSVDFVAVLARE